MNLFAIFRIVFSGSKFLSISIFSDFSLITAWDKRIRSPFLKVRKKTNFIR